MSRLNSLRLRRGHDFLPPKSLLKRIPALDATAEQGPADTIVWLHYFGVAGDWWITELDAEEGLAFGYVPLEPCPEFAAWAASAWPSWNNSRCRSRSSSTTVKCGRPAGG